MENTQTSGGWSWTISICICLAVSASFASVVPAEKVDFYRFVEGSWFDDCVPCLRPTIPTEMDGGFSLIPDTPEMWYQVFKVRDFNFRSVGGYQDYAGRFDGWYKIGGDFAFDHRMRLEGEINGKKCVFEGRGFPQDDLPWIILRLDQVVDPKGPDLGMYALHIVATPWPGELRFSTAVDFTSGNKPIGAISNGDLLATSGRVIRRNHELTRHLGIMPSVPDLGLDAVTPAALSPTGAIGELIPACEIWFSMEHQIWSESMSRWLYDGDVLSDSGKVVRSYVDLIGAFGPMPPTPEVGLDALATNAGGQILFSVKQDFFSEKLGTRIGHGDLLCEDGTIYRTLGQLLANFQPALGSPESFGLDAVLLMPRDEIWFSTVTGFDDKNLGPISDGDLLSTKGRIVMRNLHLLREFAPLEKLANFGLDAVEFASRSPLGDYDADCDVQLDDFAELAARWMDADCVECGGVDLTWDGVVGISDLFIFADHWLMGASRPQLAYKIGDCGSVPFPNTDPRFTVKVQGQYVYFSDVFGANCCAKGTALTMDFDGQTIRLDEIEYPGAPCDCFCPYPVSAVMGPFAPGIYKLDVWETTEGFTRLVGSVEVVIGPTIQYSIGPCGGMPLPNPDPRFTVKVQGQFVYFSDVFVANCCAEDTALQMSFDGQTIRLDEIESPGSPCNCICGYPVSATIGPFAPGTYTLAVWQTTEGFSRFIGSVEVVIGPTIQYSVGPCGGRVAPPVASADLRFSVQVEGRFIQFKDAIFGNCCDDKIELTMDVQGDEITVLETEYAERLCRCMCTFPTTGRLGPFEPGTYTLAVVQQDANGKRLIGTVKVTVD